MAVNTIGKTNTPQSRAQGQTVAVPALAKHLDFAGVLGPQAFEDLYGGGLARAVWSEQAEALTAAHFEVEGGHGNDLAVALDQTPAAHCARRIG